MKTSELNGPALDWAVAKCEGKEKNWGKSRLKPYPMHCGQRYSTDWAQGGPIIEREKMAIMLCESVGDWLADLSGTYKVFTAFGPTPLVAAMRCYVASKLGDEVDVPEELK